MIGEALVLGSLAATTVTVLALTGQGLAYSWRTHAASRARHPLSLRIVGRQDLTADVFTLTLASPRRRALPPLRPGQHVVVEVPGNGKGVVKRAYTVASWDAAPRAYTLAIKREPGGAASSWLHANARIGATLQVSRPRGHFHSGLVEDSAEVVLVAAGIGITPMRAMIQAWRQQPRPPQVTLHYSARTREGLFFHDEFAQLASAAPWFHYAPRITSETGRLSAQHVLAGSEAPDRTAIAICASQAMEEQLVAGLTENGVPIEQIHRERFGLSANGSHIQATVTVAGRTFAYDGAPTLLHALEARDIAVPSECRAGECGACRVTVREGRTRNILSGTEESGPVLACCSVPSTEHLALDIGAAPQSATTTRLRPSCLAR